MRKLMKWAIVPAVVVAAACGRSDAPKADDGLKNDLALASQVQPYQPQQFVSPMEQWNGQNPYQQPYMQNGYGYPAPQPSYSQARTTSTRTRTASTRRSGTYSGRRSGSSSGTVYRAPTIHRNTKRDAAIGAGAGAVIGAVSSRNKVKGAVIGGVAGAVLGGIIGHTVDVQRTP